MDTEPPTHPNPLKASFADLNFLNTAANSLPIEHPPDTKSHRVSGYNYSRVPPTPRENPIILSLSAPALELLDLSKEKVQDDPDTKLYLAGNKPIPGSDPIAMCYCGHQFGLFAGQLGDGRAITLGDIRNQKGELWELQFKGSGQTPYSRFADGKAVLRSSIREYLCSEALWALGVPTTRAASLIVTDTLADRDPLYTGRNIKERCAVVMRLAPSFWRFGSFEIFKPRDPLTGDEGPSYGLEKNMLPPMLDYLLENHFPGVGKLGQERGLSKGECYFEMFGEVVRRTARLFAMWQCVGFCHGVLNTDNMSILGLTIDYGPYGFMDYFDRDYICNHSDNAGRYSYQNQPSVGKWNLVKLAEALRSQVDFERMKGYVESEYDVQFKKYYYGKMREKLGLYHMEDPQDTQLIDEIFNVMHSNASDFTSTFRRLAKVPVPSSESELGLTKDLLDEFAELSPSKETLASRYKPQYAPAQFARMKQFAAMNPEILVAMGFSPSAVEQEEERIAKHKELLELNDEQQSELVRGRWGEWLTQYQKRLFLDAAAGKKEAAGPGSHGELCEERVKRMNRCNPLFVLRNYMAEEVIKKANKGDFSGVNNLLELLMNPFEHNEKFKESETYQKLPPKWAAEICVSCSS